MAQQPFELQAFVRVFAFIAQDGPCDFGLYAYFPYLALSCQIIRILAPLRLELRRQPRSGAYFYGEAIVFV